MYSGNFANSVTAPRLASWAFQPAVNFYAYEWAVTVLPVIEMRILRGAFYVIRADVPPLEFADCARTRKWFYESGPGGRLPVGLLSKALTPQCFG